MSGLLGRIRRFAPWIAIAVGAVLAALGVLSRTVWAPDPLWTASLKPDQDTRLIISDPGMLDLLASEVTISATVAAGEDLAPEDADPEGGEEPADGAGDEGEGTDEAGEGDQAGEDAATEADEDLGVVIAIARDVDAKGWVGDAAALRITGLASEDTLRVQESPGDLEAAAAVDSDLWWHVASGTDDAELTWKKEPGRWSVVIASSADKKISSVSFTWPQSTDTPLATPLILVGGLLILLGAALLIFPRLLDRQAGSGPETSQRSMKSKTKRLDQPERLDDSDPLEESERADENSEDPAPSQPALQALETNEPEAAENQAEPRSTEAQSASERPEPGAGPATPSAAEPAVRFTPGTMTRRQIRELERARLEAARGESARPEPVGEPSVPEQPDPDVRQDQSPEQLLAELAAGDDSAPVRRSDQWRKTWGFTSQAESSPQTQAWLPQEVSDEEEDDA